MKEGKTMEELTGEVRRQAGSREDFLLSTHETKLISGMVQRVGSKEPALSLLEAPDGGAPEPSAPEPGTSLASHLATAHGVFGMTELALEQLATLVGMPRRYLRRLQVQNPNLLDLNINTLLLQEPRQRLVRTLDGQARAILSNRYRRLDNDALLDAVSPVLEEQGGLEVKSAELTPQRLYLKLVSPRLQGEVRVGDPVQAGLVISNSEVGAGAVSVELLIYRLVCTNGAIVGDGVGRTRRYHIGAVLQGVDQTSEDADTLFWGEVQEAVRDALHERHFQEVLERMKSAAAQRLEADPDLVTARLAGRYNLRDSERDAVLQRLLEEDDLTQWGLANAVTRMSQDTRSYERATELERLGGALLHLSHREWRGLSLN